MADETAALRKLGGAVSEAIRRIGAGPVALTGSLGPIVTLLLAWLLLDEALGVTQLAGAALVITGVMVMAQRSAIHPLVNLPVRTGGNEFITGHGSEFH